MPPLLIVDNISKRFGITQALDSVSCSFEPGEVHALMGENGAGKSTLGKTIAGLHKPDTGSITLAGRTLIPGDLDDATAAGVRIVHQELAQCPNLTVAENLCLHDLPRTTWGTVDRAAMNRRAARLLADIEPSIDPTAPLGNLSPGHRQIVQIAASLDEQTESRPRVIIFDEPTSSLSIAETERLMQIVRQLAAKGLTCLYVSHRMSEIFACCDRVTVLRDGKFVATTPIKSLDEPTLVEQMIGRRIMTPPKRADSLGNGPNTVTSAPTREPILTVKNLTSPGKLDNISLQVRPGEILGVGGLVGAGRSELLDAIFGLDHHATGTVAVAGQALRPGKPRQAMRAGVGYVPEDRKLQGLFFQLGIDENILVPVMPDMSAAGIRNLNAERTWALDRIKDFQVKAATPKHQPGSLSGGNQQKLLIARWMTPSVRVLLLDEPTRGIDVGTKAEIYKIIRAAVERESNPPAILLVSSEMPELLALSDRLIVLAEGKLVGELTGQSMTQTNIMRLAATESHTAA